MPIACLGSILVVVHALVTSYLGYCNMAYIGLPLKICWNLLLVQDSDTRNYELTVHELTIQDVDHHL